MVFDLRPEPLAELRAAGAKIATSLKELGAFGEIVAICVRDDEQTRAVVLAADGVLSGMARGHLLAIHSTVSPNVISDIAEAAETAGVDLVDAPVSGGERGAMIGRRFVHGRNPPV